MDTVAEVTSSSDPEPQLGIIPRAVSEIFAHIGGQQESKFLVRLSYLQIYNEVVSDLLRPERTNLSIRRAKGRGITVDGLTEWVVRSPAEIFDLVRTGQTARATGNTKMNVLSSRSHAILSIVVEQSSAEGASTRVGKLNLVDLAGSERVRDTGATGQRLEESKSINQSLSTLGAVISALTAPQRPNTPRRHVPYRNSKLTRLLEDSIGGNCKTLFLATVSPCPSCYSESLSALGFANRAKRIKNEAKVNDDASQAALIRRYRAELARLENERARIDELLDSRERAEKDKMQALAALEERSRECLKERQDRRRLEERIQALQSQLLSAGAASAAPEAEALRQEYLQRLKDLEDERAALAAASPPAALSNQISRYRELLQKQRNIMLALTARLTERDETLVALQEEVDMLEVELETEKDTSARLTAVALELQKNARSQLIGSDGTLTAEGHATASRSCDNPVLHSPVRRHPIDLSPHDTLPPPDDLLRSAVDHDAIAEELERERRKCIALQDALTNKVGTLVAAEVDRRLKSEQGAVQEVERVSHLAAVRAKQATLASSARKDAVRDCVSLRAILGRLGRGLETLSGDPATLGGLQKLVKLSADALDRTLKTQSVVERQIEELSETLE